MRRADRAAGGLADRAPLTVGQALGEAAVLPEAHARGNRVRQRDSTAGRLRGLRGTLGTAAPAVVTLVGAPIGADRSVLQRGEHQQSHAAEPEQVDSGDPEHEGSPTHVARLAHR